MTLDDFYSLDMGNPTEWQVISPGTYDSQVWEGSSSEDESDEEDEDDDAEDNDV